MAIIIDDNKGTYFSLSRALACSSCEKCLDGHEAENSMNCQPCKPGISLFLRQPDWLEDKSSSLPYWFKKRRRLKWNLPKVKQHKSLFNFTLWITDVLYLPTLIAITLLLLLGYYKGSTMTNCTLCPTGYYQENPGQPNCTQCPQGYYCRVRYTELSSLACSLFLLQEPVQ